MQRVFRRLLTVLFLTFLLLGVLYRTSAGAASDAPQAGGPRLFDNGDGTSTLIYVDSKGVRNDVLTFDFNDEDYLIMTGKHRAGGSDWHYYTSAYYLTASASGRCISEYKGRKRRVERALVTEDVQEDDMLITRYCISWEDIFAAAESLFDEKSLSEKVTMYMSNVFEVRNRAEGDRQYGSDVTDLDVMLNRSDRARSLPYGMQWSETTLRLLPAYYDIPITFERIYIPTEIVRTNCSDCALNFVKNRFSENGMSFCPLHRRGEVWFVVGDGKDTSKITRRNGEFVGTLPSSFQMKDKNYTVDADVSGSPGESGYYELQNCRSYFAYYDEGKKSNDITEIRNAFPYDSEGEIYRLFMKKNGRLGIRVRRSSPQNGVVIVPYRLDEELSLPEASVDEGTFRIEYMDPEAEVIFSSEHFDVSSSIPGTEAVKIDAFCSGYLVSGCFQKISGTKVYPIAVVLPYSLTYKGPPSYEYDEIKKEYTEIPGPDITLNGSISGVINVTRSFSYTQIKKFDVYEPKSFEVQNGALSGGEVCIPAAPGKNVSVSSECFAPGDPGHLEEPIERLSTIVLPTYSMTTSSTAVPTVPSIHSGYFSYVDSRIGQIRSRNDRLSFEGRSVMSAAYAKTYAPTPDFALIRPAGRTAKGEISGDDFIACASRNGEYESSAAAVYRLVYSALSPTVDSLSYPVKEINDIYVHTPVVCKGTIVADNRQYVQLIGHDDRIPLVVGKASSVQSVGHEYASSDFVIGVSNYGSHKGLKGYGLRDYFYSAEGEAGAYIRNPGEQCLNQVCFPFPVHLKGDDGLFERIEPGEWVTLGNGQRYGYITEEVADGTYELLFRTIASNALQQDTLTEENFNSDPDVYIAADTVQVRVSGKLYGLKLTSVDDVLLWDSSDFPAVSGACDEIGFTSGMPEKKLLPLVDGDSGKTGYYGAMKAGYDWSFSFKTTGDSSRNKCAYVEIIPSFFHVDSRGKLREEAELYYNDYVSGSDRRLVRIGSETDLENRKDTSQGVFSYGHVRLYGMGGDWSFVYALPSDVCAVKKGTDVGREAFEKGVEHTESFFYDEGYIVVNFKIKCYDCTGRELYSYSNTPEGISRGFCSMWDMEKSLRSKTDFRGNRFSFSPGDVLLVCVGRDRRNDFEVDRLS